MYFQYLQVCLCTYVGGRKFTVCSTTKSCVDLVDFEENNSYKQPVLHSERGLEDASRSKHGFKG